MKKVQITKFHPLVSHDVDDIVEFEDAFAQQHIEAGYAVAVKDSKAAKKNEDGSQVVNANNDINDINEAEDHLSEENRGPIKGAETQDHDGNVIETKIVDGKHVEAESDSSIPTVGSLAGTKVSDKKAADAKTANK
ncbi:hypothetical protein [Dyadobacter sp. Leaf189]|uniref:hypothetical protein n=1 Tax=Dyadobacter sp. Leaf189 TaxID=1736295 RepID=UPI0006FDA038|nr:hypothetical protein [Dyadobacter sp. Leaf189]KQS33966.1 hypothetical protein ASG33_08015 [Dyadobacter sp. Leaf189]